jgi:hypothetical protein
VLEGYNGCLLAYGQTGSGKTFTMMGPSIDDDNEKGITPRAIEQIFDFAAKADERYDERLVARGQSTCFLCCVHTLSMEELSCG